MDRAAMDAVKAAFVARRERGEALRLRHAGAACRARLSAREFHLAADQPAHRRIWRLAREPPALSARSVRGDARPCGRRTSRCRCASPPPTGPKAASPATMRSLIARAFAEAGVDLVDVSTGQTVRGRSAGLWPHVPDAVLRAGPQRSPRRHHVRRQHHHRRIRSTPSSPPAAPIWWRWGGRIWSIRRLR